MNSRNFEVIVGEGKYKIAKDGEKCEMLRMNAIKRERKKEKERGRTILKVQFLTDDEGNAWNERRVFR